MKTGFSDTIVALSTAPGSAAIAVVRLSGPQALDHLARHFSKKNMADVASHTAHFGRLIREENGGTDVIDEVVVTVFRGPNSYTGEDVVEISCHGSSYIVQRVLELFVQAGCRTAQPGEFTMRAFLNGKMDLSQAEAVADLIAAENKGSHDLALRQMRGGYSDYIKSLRQELIDFAALIELELDFGEEDVEFAQRDDLKKLVEKIRTIIGQLLASFRLGNVLKNGVVTVIAGRPNSGKSTLLNALLNEERAIVSDIAGTTRDTIEEVVNIDGIAFRLIDTAGIRDARDSIEQIGVRRTMDKLRTSALILFVFDVTETSRESLLADVEEFLATEVGRLEAETLFLANKMDLNPYTRPEDFYSEGVIGPDNLLPLSARNQMNIEALKKMLYDAVIDRGDMGDQTIVSNSRHVEALMHTDEALVQVLTGMASGISGDLLAMDIRQALRHLGEITGEIHTDDLLDSIFGRFCIGK